MGQEAMGASDASVVYRFGHVQFDPTRLELRVAGSTVEVQRKPLEVLALLLANAGEVVTKEELVETVWRGRPLVDNVVPSAVARLRLALGGDGATTIVTHHRIGYRFTGTLERIAVQATGSNLELAPGDPVPGRRTFILTQMLSRSRDREVWSAQHAKTSERRVYKLCATGHMLAA